MPSKVPNLHHTKSRGLTYYRYRQPDGSYVAMGKDFDVARVAALELNRIRDADAGVPRARLSAGSADRTLAQVCDEYEPIRLRQTNSSATQAESRRLLKNVRQWMGDWPVARVKVVRLDDKLLEVAEGLRAYKSYRQILRELFAYALAKGWRKQIDGNPAEALLPPRMARQSKPKQRARLSLEQYESIYVHAPAWLQVAMDISLQTGLRRADVCNLTFDDYRDGCLFVVPQKTREQPNPPALKIKAGPVLREVVRRARSMKPLSPYIVCRVNSFHRTAAAEARQHITQVLPEQLTRHFKRSRDIAKGSFVGLSPEQMPTFHEIRSLCSRLYEGQGREVGSVQMLLAHGDESMTEYYQSGDGIKWQETWADLKV